MKTHNFFFFYAKKKKANAGKAGLRKNFSGQLSNFLQSAVKKSPFFLMEPPESS